MNRKDRLQTEQRLQDLLEEQRNLNDEMQDLLHRGYQDWRRIDELTHRLHNVAFGVNRCRMCLFGYTARERRRP